MESGVAEIRGYPWRPPGFEEPLLRTDRLVFRVLLAGGAVAELALERSGGWFLVGVAD